MANNKSENKLFHEQYQLKHSFSEENICCVYLNFFVESIDVTTQTATHWNWNGNGSFTKGKDKIERKKFPIFEMHDFGQ